MFLYPLPTQFLINFGSVCREINTFSIVVDIPNIPTWTERVIQNVCLLWSVGKSRQDILVTWFHMCNLQELKLHLYIGNEQRGDVWNFQSWKIFNIFLWDQSFIKKKKNNNNYLTCKNNFSQPTLEHMVSKVSTIPNTSTGSYILTDKAG